MGAYVQTRVAATASPHRTADDRNCFHRGGFTMRDTQISVPELGLIAGTRVALGAGLGLLLSDRLSESQRRAVGWTLFLGGAISTIPLAFEVFGKRRDASQGRWSDAPASDPWYGRSSASVGRSVPS